MPETVEFIKDKNYILVRSFGDTGIEDWKRSMKQVRKIFARTGARSVLVDVREQTTTPDTFDIFEFGENLPGDLKFAIVSSETTRRDQDFLETVGRNRAKPIRLFGDYEEATNWLKL